jgi:NAD(P)-dependent dehydrogenase (short-subunit alcohol dehydrogenase family)
VALTLRGRRALVTGAGRAAGLGRAIALRLAGDGAAVAITFRSAGAESQAVLEELRALGVDVVGIEGDVRSRVGCEHVVERAIAELGGLDVLVNNAGVWSAAPFLDMSADEWDRDVAVNLSAVFHCSQLAARHMIERGTPGRIVVITSSSSEVVTPSSAAYCASKGGADTLVRAMAYELAPYAITVNAVAPGPAGPTALNAEIAGPTEARAATERSIPLGRMTSPDDVAGAVAFLAAPDSAQITGARLSVDGGYTLGKDQTAA